MIKIKFNNIIHMNVKNKMNNLNKNLNSKKNNLNFSFSFFRTDNLNLIDNFENNTKKNINKKKLNKENKKMSSKNIIPKISKEEKEENKPKNIINKQNERNESLETQIIESMEKLNIEQKINKNEKVLQRIEKSDNLDNINNIDNKKFEKKTKINTIILMVTIKNILIRNEVYFPVFQILKMQNNINKFISHDLKKLLTLKFFCSNLNSIIIHTNIIKTKAFTIFKIYSRKKFLFRKNKIDNLIVKNSAEVNWEIDKRLIQKRKQIKLLKFYYKLYEPFFKQQVNYSRKIMIEFFENWRSVVMDEKIQVLKELQKTEEEIDIYSEKIVNYENNTENLEEVIKTSQIKSDNCEKCKKIVQINNPPITSNTPTNDFNLTSSILKEETMHEINVIPQFKVH